MILWLTTSHCWAHQRGMRRHDSQPESAHEGEGATQRSNAGSCVRELDTQYKDCKKGRCKLPSLRGVLEQTGNTGTQVLPNVDNAPPASCRPCTSGRTRICHTK